VLSITFYFILIFFFIFCLIFYFLRLKNKKEPQSNYLYTEALNAMVIGNDEIAIKLLRLVVKEDTDHIRAYLQLGNILRKNKPSQALKIHQSLTIRPNLLKELKIDIHQALAKDYEVLGNSNFAKIEAEKIIDLDKKNLWALEFILRIDEKAKQWDNAIKWMKQIQKITGNYNKNELAKFEVFKAKEKFLNGELNQALIIIKKIIKNFPDLSISYLFLGDIYEKTRDLVKAVENWEEYASRDPEKASEVFIKIESGLFDLGLFSEVENFYRRFIKKNPSSFDAVIRLANVLEEKGENASALSLVDSFDDQKEYDIRKDLMKLKLSLINSTPIELSQQVDLMLSNIDNGKSV